MHFEGDITSSFNAVIVAETADPYRYTLFLLETARQGKPDAQVELFQRKQVPAAVYIKTANNKKSLPYQTAFFLPRKSFHPALKAPFNLAT